MSRVRTIAEASVHDYEGAIDVLSRAARHIEEHLPGTVVWDMHLDQTAGRLVMYEEFVSEQALVEYEQSMADHGFRDELLQCGKLERVVVLGPVSDPDVLALLQQFGAVPVSRTLGVSR